MAASFYRELLAITEEIEGVLALEEEGYEEHLAPLLQKRREVFSRMADIPLDREHAVLIKRIRVTEDKCMALARNRMDTLQKELLAMNKGRRALVAYGKQA